MKANENANIENPFLKPIAKQTKKEPTENYSNQILMLDNIQDPGNMGTIIRSAAAFHFDTIIVGNDCVDVYSPKVVRASQGMLFHVNIIVKPLGPAIEELKKQNYQILATNVTGGNNLKTLEKKEKFAIIMGNEGQGVKKELLNKSDSYLYIDIASTCESLNVGVAASIIMYELDK